MDEVWITRDTGTKTTHSLTVSASTVLGVADALVQASLMGLAAELLERYMQASVAGTAAAGLQFVSSFVIFFLLFVCLFVCIEFGTQIVEWTGLLTRKSPHYLSDLSSQKLTLW